MYNRRFTLALLFLVALSTGAVAAIAAPQTSASGQDATEQKPAVTPAPGVDAQKPEAENAPQTSGKPDYSKEAFVIEKLQEHYRFENDGTGHKDAILRVHVLSEAGVRGFGQLPFGYNSANDRMEIGYVRVTKADGSVVTAGPDAIQDLSGPMQRIAPVYTDYRVKEVTVPGLRPGDVLECEVITTFHTAITPGHFWLEHNFNRISIVLDEQLEVDIPAGRTIKLKTKPGFDPKITEEKGRKIYRWSSSHLTQEDDGKDSKSKKKKKKKADDASDVQMTTFASWEEVGRWYQSLEKERRMPSKEVRAKAQELTIGLNSDLERTQALYDYVAKNFRYVSLSLGLARYQPQAAADVLHNQYGDCKDKNTLLAALLEAEGLHSSSVLINSFRKLDPDVPSPSQFNHVITMVALSKKENGQTGTEKEEVWMDTTTEVAPFRLLSYTLRKKQALVIPEDGAPHLEETPADPPMLDRELAEIEGKVDESGRLEATVSYTLRGDAELIQRSNFRHMAPAQWQKHVEGLNKPLGGDVTNVKVSDPSATREPFTISYQVSKGNFVDWSKKKVELKLPFSRLNLASVSADVGEDDEDSESAEGGAGGSTEEDTFKLGPPNEHTYRLKLELASRYHATPPVPITLERDYGVYQSSYKIDGNTFTAERKATIRLGELPPARADDYRAFRRSALADGAQSLTIDSTVADTHSAPADMKTGDLIRSGNEARKNGNYALAVALLNRAVEADPKSKRAWDALGLAYFDDGQDGLALNAFQKQVEVNPFDENAYNNLGRVYLRQRKYDEADKWFKKQIEVQPLDKYAHTNLGVSLVEQHKYEEAVPELEKGAAVRPDYTVPQINLGAAYLNLGQDDKAMAAFDKALTISATPSVWNSIAYELALKKSHLDVARRYAESAVSETAARLRNLSLDQLKQNDLRRTPELASYWDTLGWVAFAEGNLDAAEKHVAPAWQLSRGGEAGDHLAQIYEKRGNKAEAAHLYALALQARRPEAETRARLASLLGSDAEVDAAVEKHRDESQQERTIKLANPNKLDGKAEFWILLSTGKGSEATVEAVKLASGDDQLKPLTESLQTAKYKQIFPDDTPVKIVRQGTATCKAAGDCTFLLALPDDVKSVD
jgi:Flp pilus assembly protein TadD